MKYSKFLLSAVAAVIFVTFTNCCGNNAEPQTEPTDDTLPTEQPTYLSAIEDYLVSEIGASYSKGDVCIPYYEVVYTDETDTTDIRVWGDWWVDNYNIAGDTLITVSGGNHPGLFHVRKEGTRFEVIAFDQVEDGAGNAESAKRIFGEHYDEYKGGDSCGLLDEIRYETIARYVKEHSLNVTLCKDYGWPAVVLKLE